MDVSLDTCGRRGVGPLLFIYLFVVNAAADCPKPQGTGNIVLTDEALLMNDFPEGSHVTLECANGYVNESGSGITTCIAGNWNGPDLICKKKDCGLPKPQPNMGFNISTGTLFGDVIKVVCDKGYQVSGSSYKQCYASGWTGRAKCEIVTCDRPGKVANGISSGDSQDDPKYGEIIHYVCNEGYTLIGNNNIMCGETGEYDSQPPECKGVTKDVRITTKMATPTSTPPEQEVPTSTASSVTPTARRDKAITTSATPTVSLSTRTATETGVREDLTAEDKARARSTSTTSFQDRHDGIADINKDIGYMPIIVSVICVSLAFCIGALFLRRFLLRRKGSYDTREDLKPELLQFQNL